jgi:(p)ppGpp synthase/HD superfamily hydrolase
MDDLILRAARFARDAHRGQRRKFGGGPYIAHPGRVAAQAMLLDDLAAEEVAAAWLHDVIEDCGVTAEDLRAAGFPDKTVELVVELTNPSKRRKDLGRAARKQLDRDHLRGVSREAKRLKMLDRIDNLQESSVADEAFRSLYVAESLLLVDCLKDVDPVLAERIYVEIERLGFARDHTDPRCGVEQ